MLDYILATRFNCSLRQIRHAVCSIAGAPRIGGDIKKHHHFREIDIRPEKSITICLEICQALNQDMKSQSASEVLTLRTILSAAVELGLLVSQDADLDGSVSAKPFIDNMIHVISE